MELGHLQVLPNFDPFRIGLSPNVSEHLQKCVLRVSRAPDLWSWNVVIQFCWKKPAHFSELKMDSLSSSLVASPLQGQFLRGSLQALKWDGRLLPMLGIFMRDLGLRIGQLPPTSAHGIVNFALVL